jgi:gamma-glutamyl hydrolase
MIGIITAPNLKQDIKCEHSYMKIAYLHWIEMSGEQAIIIPYDIKEKELEVLLSRIQGVVWVGGGIENSKFHTHKQYTTLINTLFYCYQYAIRENDKGNYYPLWGTCLGFDILLMFANHLPSLKETLTTFSLYGSYPCTFTSNDTKLKKWFPSQLRQQMKKQPCVFHNHIYGNTTVPDTVNVVSMHHDFINMIEFKQYPFYGVQFHPEQPHTELGIQVSRQFSLFFKNECNKNKNKWKWKLSDFKPKEGIKLI